MQRMARLGELLVQAGAITADQLQFALRYQKQHGGRLGTNLVELGFLSESALAKTLSAQLRLPAVSAGGKLALVEPVAASAPGGRTADPSGRLAGAAEARVAAPR